MSRQARDVDGVDIVPAIFVQVVVDNGIAQHELNLALGHTGFQFVDHGLSDHVALLNGDSMYPRELICGTSGQ